MNLFTPTARENRIIFSNTIQIMFLVAINQVHTPRNMFLILQMNHMVNDFPSHVPSVEGRLSRQLSLTQCMNPRSLDTLTGAMNLIRQPFTSTFNTPLFSQRFGGFGVFQTNLASRYDGRFRFTPFSPFINHVPFPCPTTPTPFPSNHTA